MRLRRSSAALARGESSTATRLFLNMLDLSFLHLHFKDAAQRFGRFDVCVGSHCLNGLSRRLLPVSAGRTSLQVILHNPRAAFRRNQS